MKQWGTSPASGSRRAGMEDGGVAMAPRGIVLWHGRVTQGGKLRGGTVVKATEARRRSVVEPASPAWRPRGARSQEGKREIRWLWGHSGGAPR